MDNNPNIENARLNKKLEKLYALCKYCYCDMKVIKRKGDTETLKCPNCHYQTTYYQLI